MHFGPRASNCTIQSGRPAATSTKGHELKDTLIIIDVPTYTEEYDAGNGVKWTEESMSMAAGTEHGVQKLDTPELEGSTYMWVRPMDSDIYAYGFWYGDGCMIVVKLFDLENKLDGPQTVQEALDVMPELLTYVGTRAQKHDILPAPKPSDTPTTEPAGTEAAPAADSEATADAARTTRHSHVQLPATAAAERPVPSCARPGDVGV